MAPRKQVSHGERVMSGRRSICAWVTALWDSWFGLTRVIDDRGEADSTAGVPGSIRPDQPSRHALSGPPGPLNVSARAAGTPCVRAGGVVRDRPPLRRAPCRGGVHGANGKKPTAKDFYAESENDLAAAEGRSGRPRFLSCPGLSPVHRRDRKLTHTVSPRELNNLSDPEVGRKRLSGRFGGHDFSHLPWDKPLSPEDFPDPATWWKQPRQPATEVIIGLVRPRKNRRSGKLLGYMAGGAADIS